MIFVNFQKEKKSLIRNIIFDLGNVLLSFKPEDFLMQYTTDLNRIDGFLSKITRSQTWWQLDQGLITMKKAEAFFNQKYSEELDLLIPFYANWMNMLKPIAKNVQFLNELKRKDYKLYVLSNFIKEAYEYVSKQYNFLKVFDGKILSWKEKVVKPDLKIYKKLIEKYQINPQESVFLDDIKGFLKPAESLGMKTIWIKQNTDIRKELRKLDIII